MANEETLNIWVRLKDFATTQLNKLNATVKGFGTGAVGAFKGITGAVFSLKGALAGLGVALTVKGLTDLVKATANEADELRDLSKQLGTSTEFLSAFKFAAGQAGVEIGEVEVGLRTLRKNLGEIAVTGKGEAQDALNLLSRSFNNLVDDGGSLEEIVKGLAKELKALPETERVFAASKLFGRGGGALLQLFAEDVDAALAKAKELGIVISGEAADAADAFNDSLGELSASLKGIRNQAILPLLPELSRLAKSFTEELVKNRPEILRFFADIIENAGKFATIIGKTFEGIREVINFTQTAITDFNFNSATNEVNKISRRIDALNDQLTKLSDQGVDIFGDPTRSAKIFEQRRKEYEALAKAQGELNDVTERSAALSTEQARQSELASGATERGAADAAKAIRGVADAQEEVRKTTQALALANELVPLLPTEKLTDAYEEQGDAVKELTRNVSSLNSVRATADSKPLVPLLPSTDFDEILEDQRKLNLLLGEEAEARALVGIQVKKNQQARLEEQNAIAGAGAAFKTLREDSQKFGEAANDAILNVAGSLSENLTTGILDLTDGVGSARDAFKNLAKSAVADLQRIIVQTLILKAVQAGLGGVGGLAFNQGGVFPGGVKPVRGLAQGDVIRPPGGVFQLAEKGRSEAVLPLVRGRNGDLGVQAQGAGGGMTQVVNVTVNYNGTIGEKALFARNVEQIRQAVAQGVRSSPNYREQIRTAA